MKAPMSNMKWSWGYTKNDAWVFFIFMRLNDGRNRNGYLWNDAECLGEKVCTIFQCNMHERKIANNIIEVFEIEKNSSWKKCKWIMHNKIILKYHNSNLLSNLELNTNCKNYGG